MCSLFNMCGAHEIRLVGRCVQVVMESGREGWEPCLVAGIAPQELSVELLLTSPIVRVSPWNRRKPTKGNDEKQEE